jgi:hypothetical protein
MTEQAGSAISRLEQRFSLTGFLLRLLFALVIVALTYNPTRFSFFHWARDAFLANALGPLHFLAGIGLLIGWTIFVRATSRSLGLLGIALVAALFAVLIWLLIDYDVLALDSSATLIWIIVAGVAIVLATGISWSHIRRRLSGQTDVDDLDSR